MIGPIWVVCEQRQGSPRPISLELVSAASQWSEEVCGIAYGESVSDGATVLGAHGLRRLFDLGDLGDALVGPRVASAISAAITSNGAPSALFIPATYDGRDIAGRLSAKLDLPLLTNVVGLSEQDGVLVSEHAIFGGTRTVTARFTNDADMSIFVIRPKSFEAKSAGGPAAEIGRLELPKPGPADAAQVIEHHVEERTGPSLDEASVVVSGGRGLGEPANYALVEQLATLLHGAPGATRAIVDAGWVPYAYQVGQTGKVVKPEVYLACGISGAIQHLAGMKNSRHIVAINKDPLAPIFQSSDFGVVGDVNKLLPRLIKALEARAR